MASDDDTPSGIDRQDNGRTMDALPWRQALPTPDTAVPLSDPLPGDLPPAVVEFFQRRCIVARGQAAAAIACLILSEELRVAEGQHEADLRVALTLIGVDPKVALEALIVRFPAPPAGVHLTPPAAPAAPDDAELRLWPAPTDATPESEDDHG